VLSMRGVAVGAVTQCGRDVVAALEALRRGFEGAAGQGTGLGAEEGTPADGQGDGDCQENCQREERSPINSHLPSRFTVASAL